MRDLARHLLDVLKDTLAHQEQICRAMEQHKQLLIDAKEIDGQSILARINEHCLMVQENERKRQEIVTAIAEASGVDATALNADALVQLPLLKSVCEEVKTTTAHLRQTMRRISQLRDEIQGLAEQAKAYSEMFLATLHQATTKPNRYGSQPVLGSRIISVQT